MADKIGTDINDELYGTDGADNIQGLDGNDTLFGEGGNDTLDGGSGIDTMTGGFGDDTFIVDNAGDVTIESAGQGCDVVKSGVSYTLAANVEHLLLTGTGNIDGTGNDRDNFIGGNSGDNILTGGAGNDSLAGYGGADTLIGGTGDDNYYVYSSEDLVIEYEDEGIDTVKSLVSYTLGANLENLTLTGTRNIDGTGNALNNIIIGNSGNNVLKGGAGHDFLIGGLGADTMIGGTGIDEYQVDNVGDVIIEKPGEGYDAIESSVSYTLPDNVEELWLLEGTSNINGTGNSGDDCIYGNAGNNILDGGAGADELHGGKGDDTYIVDNNLDLVIEKKNAGIDSVRSSISYNLGANLENLTLTGTGDINGAGNKLSNIITGNGADNSLYGKAGNDTIYGGAGDDTLDGGSGIDKMAGGVGNDVYVVDNAGDVIIESAGQGCDVVRSSVSYTLADNVEHLFLTGTGNIDGTGNDRDNFIGGTSGDNILTGGAGDDSLAGYGGADTLIGGTGNDNYNVYSSQDLVIEYENEGIDIVKSLVDYTLGDNLENLTLTGTVNTNGTGNELNNIIIGNSGNNVLAGGLGNDTLIGGAGNDTYVWGTSLGNDVVNNYHTGINADVLQFQELVEAGIEFSRSNNDLVCAIIQTGEIMTVSNWALGSAYQVGTLQFSDGSLTSAQINAKIGLA